jgi:hypothetical protein
MLLLTETCGRRPRPVVCSGPARALAQLRKDPDRTPTGWPGPVAFKAHHCVSLPLQIAMLAFFVLGAILSPVCLARRARGRPALLNAPRT